MGREWGENPSGKFPTTFKKKKKLLYIFLSQFHRSSKVYIAIPTHRTNIWKKGISSPFSRLFCDGMFDSNRQLDFVSIVRNMPNRENRFENSYFSLSFSVLLTNVEKKKIKSEKNQS
jgi:hypothetical protein